MPALLPALGHVLCGPAWRRADLAAVLGVAPRTLRRWLSNDYLPADKIDLARQLLAERETELTRAKVQLLMRTIRC